MLMDFLVGVDYVLEFKALLTVRGVLLQNLDRLITLVYFTDSIDCTHDQLIKVTAEEQI